MLMASPHPYGCWCCWRVGLELAPHVLPGDRTGRWPVQVCADCLAHVDACFVARDICPRSDRGSPLAALLGVLDTDYGLPGPRHDPALDRLGDRLETLASLPDLR